MTLPLALLRTAALLVPAPRRAEWLDEWQSELWYVQRGAAGFCMGAFRDAFWVRRNCGITAPRMALRVASPWQCLGLLAVAAALCIYVALQLPLPRSLLLSVYRDGRLASVSLYRPHECGTATMRWEQYQSLLRQGDFVEMAYYRPYKVQWGRPAVVGLASKNLFELLGIPVATTKVSGARLVLSRAAWRKYFGGDPHVVGRTVDVGGRPGVVAAIIPDGDWNFPGRMDAWLLLDDAQLAEAARDGEGYAVGRLASAARQARWGLSVDGRRFECASLPKMDFVLICGLFTVLCLLILAMTTSLKASIRRIGHRAV
jgi:hypothetical protein